MDRLSCYNGVVSRYYCEKSGKVTDFTKNIVKHKLILGFLGVIVLFVSFGIVSLRGVHKLGGFTKMIHEYPLVVSNAALNAGIGLTKMHRSMKDVILLDSPDELDKARKAVDEHEQMVYRQLDVIRDLIIDAEGQNLEKQTRQLFIDWGSIREEVFLLCLSSRKNEAASITKGKGADHVAKIKGKMFKLTSYAREKANSFRQLAERSHTSVEIISVILVLAGVLLSSLIAFYTARHVSRNEEVSEKRIAERIAELSKANQQLLREMEEHERTDEKLKQAERKYRTVADFTYDWEYWANLDGTLEYVSPSCERISGYNVQDFMETRTSLCPIFPCPCSTELKPSVDLKKRTIRSKSSFSPCIRM